MYSKFIFIILSRCYSSDLFSTALFLNQNIIFPDDNRKLRTLRDAYYQLSPRREESDESESSEESDSDSDDPN